MARFNPGNRTHVATDATGKKMSQSRNAVPRTPLRELPFFAALSQECFSHIESFIYHRDYEKRQIIYFPDDACDYVYWLRSGRVRVMRMADDEREFSFRHVRAGDMLGEDCLGGRSRRENYAEALENTTLSMMRSDDFHRLIRENAEFAYGVIQQLSRRTMDTEQQLADSVFLPVRSRIAAALMRIYASDGAKAEGQLRLTHQELANLAGTTRETTTAVLHALRDAGLIAIANRRVTVLDPAGLDDAIRQS